MSIKSALLGSAFLLSTLLTPAAANAKPFNGTCSLDTPVSRNEGPCIISFVNSPYEGITDQTNLIVSNKMTIEILLTDDGFFYMSFDDRDEMIPLNYKGFEKESKCWVNLNSNLKLCYGI